MRIKLITHKVMSFSVGVKVVDLVLATVELSDVVIAVVDSEVETDVDSDVLVIAVVLDGAIVVVVIGWHVEQGGTKV